MSSDIGLLWSSTDLDLLSNGLHGHIPNTIDIWRTIISMDRSFRLWKILTDCKNCSRPFGSADTLRTSKKKKVQNELLVVNSSQLLEKEHSGCRTLLQDDKK